MSYVSDTCLQFYAILFRPCHANLKRQKPLDYYFSEISRGACISDANIISVSIGDGIAKRVEC